MFIPIFSYFVWHYSQGIKDFFINAKNFIWFVWHLFSIPILFKTLLSPWQKLGERYHKGEGIEGFFEVILVNTVMRAVGFIIRSIVLAFGFIILMTVLILEVIGFLIWVLLPVIIVFLFISGIRFLIR